MTGLLLTVAILIEVAGSLALRVASTGRRRWYAATAVAYFTAFALLTRVLALGLGLGVTYAIWAAAGIALTAILSKPLFKEPLNLSMLCGIAAIILGVFLIELGAEA